MDPHGVMPVIDTVMERHDDTEQPITLNADIRRTWLEMALMRSDSEVWVYEIATRTMQAYYIDHEGRQRTLAFEDAPASCVDRGHVHPNSIDTINAFFRGIDRGEREGVTSVMLKRHESGEFAWCTLSYRLVTDADGCATHAVGIRTAPRPTLEEVSPMADRFPGVLYPHLLRYAQGSITTGNMRVYLRQDQREVRLMREVSYDKAVSMGLETIFSAADEQTYLDLLDAQRLAERYRGGRRWTVNRFRMVDARNDVCTARVAVNVRNMDLDDDLIASVYVNMCETRTEWEGRAEVSAMRDPETQIYTLDYAHLLIDTLLADNTSNDICAVCCIVLDGAEKLEPSLRLDLMTAIGVFMNTDCIVYRYDDTTIGVFIPTISSASAIKERLVHMFAAARTSLMDAKLNDNRDLADVHLVASTIFGFANSFNFNTAIMSAYEMALQDREFAEDREADRVDDPLALRDVASVKDALDATVAETPDTAELNHDDLVAYSDALQAMLGSESPAQAIDSALRSIGQFYRAQRVYLIMVPRDEDTLTVLFEWKVANATSIEGLFSRSPASRFPFITTNASAEKPVFVTRERSFTRSGTADHSNPWRFALVPVSHTASCNMLMCVDGPAANFGSWALASKLGGRILHEWARLSRSTRGRSDSRDGRGFSCDDAQDLDAVLSRTNRGLWNALGILVVRLNDLEETVQQYGVKGAFEVFSQMRAILVRQFGTEFVFHVTDVEFVVLSPNQPYNAFIQHCAQARMSLLAAYPDRISLGSSWSDNSREAYRILSEARAVAQRDGAYKFNLQRPEAGQTVVAHHEVQNTPMLTKSSLADRFTIYLQPKIDMRTGELVGAEALARTIARDGSVTSPVNAIMQLEESGEISELDYFVFDAMLSLMSSWKSRGIEVVPVSSNFSRATLVGSTALASVLAILSRYPEVPVDLVEMEITEAAIDMGNITLSDLVERYRALGLRVALDDFGSHFSNVSVLANVHFDTIKLDRSIIGDLPGNEVSRLLVHNIADICKSQNMTCLAEGIESIDQARALVEEGCHYCQGFYYDRPMPVDLFERKYFHS